MRERRYASQDLYDKVRIALLFKKMQEKLKGKEYFTLGSVTHDKMMGHKVVDSLKPIFKQFMKDGLIEEAGKEGRYRFTNNDTCCASDADFSETDMTYQEELEKDISKYNRFIITTAVNDKRVNKPFLASIKNYAKRNKALVLIIPCTGKRSKNKNAQEPPHLSSDLDEFKKIYKDTYLNKHLCISALNIPATTINPLTGLDRLLLSKKASMIVASPRVFLKHIPNMHFDIPPALMSTGAITENTYSSDKFLTKKADYLAEADHTYGAVVVELEDECTFHFRHIQASNKGSFIDLGIEYFPDGRVEVSQESVMVMGDSHIGYHDEELHEEVMKLAYETDTKEIILHDIFHGSSISHHDVGKGVTNAIKHNEGRLGLKRECIAVKNYLASIAEQGLNVTIVKSNHDNHLFRYLNENRFMNDPINYAFSLKLASAAVDELDPLRYAIEEELKYKNNRIVWLQEDSGYKVYGVEVSHHGSTGSNGSKGSLAIFEKGLGNCVTAHTHSAAIVRNAFCVGTVGFMDMKYNKGLSSWTRTCCLIYNNGTKQLINFIPNSKGCYTYRI